MRLIRTRLQVTILAGAVCAAMLAFVASAFAATATYPGGGNGFSEGAEGWSAGAASCTPAELLCTSEATYDATAGNPPGSIAAKTTVTLNLVGLFKGTATWSSPQFKVPVEAVTDADVHLDQAFSPGGLVDVEPEATYVVTLSDLTTGTSTTALSGELDEEDEAFAGASAPVAVVGGHTYRLSIETVTAQSALALSLLSGTAIVRFDNVGLTVRSGSEGKGGGGGAGGKRGSGSGAGSLSDRQLFSLLSGGTSAGPATLKGKRLFVKVGCPAKVGHACRITAQGLLSKHRPATTKRTAKVAKGKSKRIALRVKPKARGKVIKRRRLLFREKVHAGPAQATVYRQRKLIRQG
jgi:hypothetical protein